MAASTGRPSRNTSRRSRRAASPRSWVTTIRIAPSRRCASSSRSITAAELAPSNAPVGSSARIVRGRWMRARATATRCRCPPESWSGSFPACSARPSRASSSTHRSYPSVSPPQRELQCDVLGCREERQQVVGLEDQADLVPADPCALALGKARDHAPADRHAAGRRRLEPSDQAEQRRLAASARSGHGEAGPGLDLESHAIDGSDDPAARRVVLRELIDPDARSLRHSR